MREIAKEDEEKEPLLAQESPASQCTCTVAAPQADGFGDTNSEDEESSLYDEISEAMGLHPAIAAGIAPHLVLEILRAFSQFSEYISQPLVLAREDSDKGLSCTSRPVTDQCSDSSAGAPLEAEISETKDDPPMLKTIKRLNKKVSRFFSKPLQLVKSANEADDSEQENKPLLS